MMTPQLNERQRSVLEWIAQGCPDREWPDVTHKTSAQALANRGLVRVTKPAGRWTAVLTDDGAYFLAHGEYPDGHHLAPKPPKPPDVKASQPRVLGLTNEPANRQEKPRPRGKVKSEAPAEVVERAIDSPNRLRQRGAGARAKSSDESPAHPWDDKVLISVKEAAWLLSVSEGMIRAAVRDGDIARVFIGAGTSNYRIVHDSLLAWVNTMPTEPVWRRGW